MDKLKSKKKLVNPFEIIKCLSKMNTQRRSNQLKREKYKN